MSEVSVSLASDEVKAALTSDEIKADLTGEEVKAGVTTDGLWNWLSLAWGKRIKIILDHDDIDAALSNFPHLVYLSASSGHSNKDVSCVFDELGSDANRKKIAITKSDGVTECYVEIDKWDDANEKAWLWVKVPDADPDEDTVLWLYYDSAHADNDTYVGDPSDAVVHNVWDANFKLVSHMRDDPDISHIRDSTVNANDGTKLAAGTPAVTLDGTIDDAQDFDTGHKINCGNAAVLDLPGIITVEACVELKEAAGTHTIISKTGPAFQDTTYWMDIRTNATAIYFGGYTPGGVAAYLGRGYAFAVGVKYYVVGVDTGAQLEIYVNGALQGAPGARANRATDVTWDVRLGVRGVVGNPINAIVDEVRVSGAAAPRSAAWIKATKESLWDHLNNFGIEELLPSRLSVELPVGLTSAEVKVTLK